MTDEWLWRDDDSGVGLRSSADGAEPLVELWLDDGVLAALDAAGAVALAKALTGWAQPTVPPPTNLFSATGGAPDSTWFQVYYRPEYHDDEGASLIPDGLGELNAQDAFVFDEADLSAVRGRARAIGEALAELHELKTGEAYWEGVAEKARAWISVFRMPDDIRTWKGFWDELEEVGNDELIGL